MDANTPAADDRDPIGPDLTALEHRLAAWRPSAGALDRDRMLYDAGRASVAVRRWRLATAALLLVSLGASGLVLHQRSLLVRERVLLAAERSYRLELETALAARTDSSRAAAAAPATAEIFATEPPAPSSYLVLTARLAAGDAASPGIGGGPEPPLPARDPAGGPVSPPALRPRDFRRGLDL